MGYYESRGRNTQTKPLSISQFYNSCQFVIFPIFSNHISVFCQKVLTRILRILQERQKTVLHEQNN
jgi:hypothetical protein